MNTLNRLQEWYEIHCDGDWEHTYGISINTMDNPGWSVKIDLIATLLEDVHFTPIQYGDSEKPASKWINCFTEESCFYGFCSATQLEEVIEIFLKWANDNTNVEEWDDAVSELNKRCDKSNFVEENIPELRKLYYEIDDIPNEHPAKKKLLDKFHNNWNELMKIWQ